MSKTLVVTLRWALVTALLMVGCQKDDASDEASLDELDLGDPGTCEVPLHRGDSDRDGVIDACDGCPRRANADQADRDGDGLQDACDGCDDRTETDCGTDIVTVMPYSSDSKIIGVAFDVPETAHSLFDELSLPLCAPSRKTVLLRAYTFADAPLAGLSAQESWIDLRADHYGTLGWQNEGIFIPEAVRFFYEPTAAYGGWKKQFVTDTAFEETEQGWRATNTVNGELLYQLEFVRGDYDGELPPHLDRVMQNPPDTAQTTEPQYILNPADFNGDEYASTNPVIYDSLWVPKGAEAQEIERGQVTVTWGRPVIPPEMKLNLRWMDLLPPSGSTFPGYFIHKVPGPETTEQDFTHLSKGHGECSAR